MPRSMSKYDIDQHICVIHRYIEERDDGNEEEEEKDEDDV